MDGARIANALAALDVTPAHMIDQCGIDLVSFGATKNGIMFGEAILSFVPELSKRLVFLRKQGMQLHSKMRYIGAQFQAYFSSGVWRRNAEHANDMARYLEAGVRQISGVEVVYKVETNAVFARIPKEKIAELQDHYFFYVWKAEEGTVRWMASFDTQKADVDSFLQCIREITG
jgi:threonine aldolase